MKKFLLCAVLVFSLGLCPAWSQPPGAEALIERALQAADEKKYSEAGRLLEQSAQLYLDQGLKNEALQIFEYAVNSYYKAGGAKANEDTDSLLRLLKLNAELFAELGQTEKSIESWTTRGNILVNLSRFGDAEQAYQSAYELAKELPDNLPLQYRTTRKLAEILDASHRWNEAAAYFRSALELAEQVAPEEAADLQVTLGAVYQLLGKSAKAEEFYKAGAQRHLEAGQKKEWAEALSGLAKMYMRERRFGEALPLWEQLAEQSENNLEAVLRSALALEGLGRLEESYELLTVNRERLEGERRTNLDAHRVKLLWALKRGEEARELLAGDVFPNDLQRAEIAADNAQRDLAKDYFARHLKTLEGEAKTKAVNLYAIRLLNWGQAQDAQALLEAELAGMSGEKTKTWATLKNNLGESFLKQGDARRALLHFEEALPWYESQGTPSGTATLLNNIAACHSQNGELAKAVNNLERAVKLVDRFQKPHPVQATVSNALGYAYVQMNRYEDGIRFYREALSRHRVNSNPKGERTVLFNLGAALMLSGQREEGYERLEQALGLAAESDDVPLMALIFTFYGEQFSDPERRLRMFRHADTLMPKIENRVVKALLLSQKAQLSIDMGQWEQAKAQAEASLALVSEGTSQQAFTARKLLFQVARHDQDVELADSLSRDLLEELESIILGLSSKEARPLVDKSGRFLVDYSQMLLDSGRLEDGFAAHEQWRSLGLAAMTRDVKLGSAHVDPELLRERERLAALIAEAQQKPGESSDLESLASSYRRVLDQIERQHLAAGLVSRVSSVTADEILAALRPNEALLEYVTGPRETYLLLLKGGKLTLYPIGENQELKKASQKAFRSAAKLYSARGTDRKFQVLGESLLNPVWADLEGVDSLVVVPGSGFYTVPFAALRVGEESVIDRFQVTVANSASAWLASRRTRSQGKGILGAALGDFSGHAGDLAPLPGTLAETAQLANLFPQAQIVLGREMTSSTLPERMSEQRNVHLATHGFLDKREPMLSGLALSDRRVTAADIFGWNLDAELAVLSACDTGGFSDDNSYLGLTSAFQYAGARTLVVSYWSVSDESTHYWMEQFYQALAQGDTASAAMRKAHLATREKWEHPFFWAPFTTWGDGLSKASEAARFGAR